MDYETTIQLSHYWLPLIGFVIGLIATMVGGNGAFFFPPALILLFGVSPRVAIATSLAAVVPIGLIGSLAHYRRDNVNLPLGILFGIAGFAGAVSGAWVSGLLDAAIIVKAFGYYVLALGAFTFFMPKRNTHASLPAPRHIADINKKQLPAILILGLLAGIAAGLFGTSGTLTVLAGLFMLQLPVKLIIGTSVLIVFINALSGFGAHLVVGEIDFRLIWLLGSGAALGAFIGPWLLHYVKPGGKEGKIRYIFALKLIALGLFLVFR